MTNRIVYVDFQDGAGFIDISAYVKYNTLTLSTMACNDSFQYAQSQVQFDVIYDATLFAKFRNATKDTLVRIVDDTGDNRLLTEASYPILTEDSLDILIEQEWFTPVFYGHMPLTHSHSYNGILDNTMFSVDATDELDLLDTPVGDIVCTGFSVYNPASPSTSIVHYLASIAGWNASRFSTDVSILHTITKFAPQNTNDSILDIISTLLYEYGYVLHENGAGQIEPIKWQINTIPVQVFGFDETNIVDSITESDTYQQYDGGTVTYYELGTSTGVRLFTDSNCKYGDDGLFAGYSIPAGYDYPPEANTIDPTTGAKQIVTQTYSDDAIQYRTNYAIRNNLDLNYSAFDSDFSAIVATANHYVDRKTGTGLTIVNETFGNKTCRLLYRNSTGSPIDIYYNDVYGDVWYKTSERTISVNFVSIPTKTYLYTMKFVYDRALANDFLTYLMARYQDGSKKYIFTSEIGIEVGTIVSITADNGISCNAIVGSAVWDEGKALWKYTCFKVIATPATASAQTVTQLTSVTTPVIQFSASTQQITIPYANGSPDFSNAYIDLKVLRDGMDVTDDWMFNYNASGVTGAFHPTIHGKFTITGISSTSASISFQASRTNWTSQLLGVSVVKGADSAGVATLTPRYKGIGILTNTSTASFTSSTVDSNGAITVVGSMSPNTGDYIVNYSGSVALGMYKWNGSNWVITTDVGYTSEAAIDLCNLSVGGITISGYTTFITAIVNTLFAQRMKLLTGGKFYSGAGNYNNADTPVYIGADGKLSLSDKLNFDGSNLNVFGTIDTETAYLKADCQIIGHEFMKVSSPIVVDLNGSNVSDIISALNTLIASSGVQLYDTEDYLNDKRIYCSTVATNKSEPLVLVYDGGSTRICNVIDRYTSGGIVKYDIGIVYYTPFVSGGTREGGSYRNIISNGAFVHPITPATNKLTISYTLPGSTTYGSQYIEGCLTARRGIHQRRRGIRGDKNTPFATKDDLFQFAMYLYRQRGISLGTEFYTIACTVQVASGQRYAGCIYPQTTTQITLSYGTTQTDFTNGDTGTTDVRYLFI